MRYGLFGLVLLGVAACSSIDELPADLAPPVEPMVWPPPPEEPRIKFLYAFREPQHLGIERSFLERVWSFIAGKRSLSMVRPYSVAADERLVVVADPGLRAVHLFDLSAQSYSLITTSGDDVLLSPVGVALAADRIYVADSGLGKVLAFDREGGALETVATLKRPTGVALDPESGRLYVADAVMHRISVFDETGTPLFDFGSRGNDRGQVNYPTHLFLRAGRLYVNDTMNFRLQVFDLEGRLLSSFGSHGDGSGDFAQPKGIGVDREGHVYVVDAIFDRVQVFDQDGRFLLAFGRSGQNVGTFWLPGGLFVADDRIYVADSYNRRVQVFQFLGGS
jgi:DNA-binding beta-propeller fold protein YncE